jgi:signal transduction histidine kinase
MNERVAGPHVRHSVFAKVVTVMLAMAATLLALVAGFFLLYINPALNASIDRVVLEYARVVAVTAPGYDTAKRLASRLDVEMRYEGPDASWATADNLPTIAEARRAGRGPLTLRRFYIVPAPDGGTYLFAWVFSEHVRTAHLVVLVVLLLLMAAVVFVTHAVLRHVLQPLRALGDGVARLGDGHLDVAVPRRSGDELGVLTDAFNQMVGRIRVMIRSRDQLLLDVSHELRSPLTRLKVALELLSDTDMKARMAADLAEMEIMIGELVELERLRDGHGIRTACQNVIPILDEVARSFQDRPPSVRVASTAPEIFAEIDAERMRTVVRNLLENAVKYSLPDSRAVDVCAAQNGEHVVIRVSDDGPGIPEHEAASLFEPFFRLDRSRSRKTGGYGLGLSISRRIVEAHGGTITIENNPRRGASFIVTLPNPAGSPRGDVRPAPSDESPNTLSGCGQFSPEAEHEARGLHDGLVDH